MENLEINKIYQGDALSVLKTFPDKSADCCVTSPPYWGLRDYGTATWVGGDDKCSHQRENKIANSPNQYSASSGDMIYRYKCPKCGAVRQDNQLGLEETPEEYVKNMVEVFSEVRRVLKDEGTLWLNLGDSYCGTGGKGELTDPKYPDGRNGQKVAINNKIQGLKPKDLVGIPWLVAFALRASGWWLRQDIIWHKRNPMPESVTDRCTKSHEYIFLLSKSQKYYYDYEAILEPYTEEMNRWGGQKLVAKGESTWDEGTGQQTYRDRDMRPNENGRNKRDVWTVNTKPYKEAHFAVYPEELIVDCIKAGCPAKGIVLDPFMGSGTTGVVARKLDRNFIGVELNPKYIKIAEKRLYDELGMFL